MQIHSKIYKISSSANEKSLINDLSAIENNVKETLDKSKQFEDGPDYFYDFIPGIFVGLKKLTGLLFKMTRQSIIYRNQIQNYYNDSVNVTSNSITKQSEFMFVKVDYSSVNVRLSEIEYIEGLKDYVKIYVNNKPLVTKSTIKHIENKLPPMKFARVHKSYIVPIEKINKIEYNHIYIGQKKIPIGMQFKGAFYKQIESYRL